MAGTYNLQNALAAIAAGLSARRTGTDPRGIVGLPGKGAFPCRQVREVDIFDDYAHHPVEITAVLGSAEKRQADGHRSVMHRIVIHACVICSPISVAV